MPTLRIRRAPREHDPLPPQVIDEFNGLLARLDLHYMRPEEWARFKTILVTATLEAADLDSGARGYANALAKWRVSRFYDGD